MKNSFDQHVKDYIDHLCDEACEAHFRNEALLFEMQEEARCKNWQHDDEEWRDFELERCYLD